MSKNKYKKTTRHTKPLDWLVHLSWVEIQTPIPKERWSSTAKFNSKDFFARTTSTLYTSQWKIYSDIYRNSVICCYCSVEYKLSVSKLTASTPLDFLRWSLYNVTLLCELGKEVGWCWMMLMQLLHFKSCDMKRKTMNELFFCHGILPLFFFIFSFLCFHLSASLYVRLFSGCLLNQVYIPANQFVLSLCLSTTCSLFLYVLYK